MHSSRTRRRILLPGLLIPCLLAVGCSSGTASTPGHRSPERSRSAGTPSPSPSAAATSPSPSPLPPPPQLPRGGRVLFPAYRVVAYYGSEGGPALGVLGDSTPDGIAARIETAAAPFATPGRPVLPAMELITTLANSTPGPEGDYSIALSADSVARYLAAARRHRMLLLLDLQPGCADFLPQAKRYEQFLREPDVGLALDPEWKMTPCRRPGRIIGHTDAVTINSVSTWLNRLVVRYRLPQKLFVIHQFRTFMVVDKPAVAAPPGLAVTFHIDGFGVPKDKRDVYAILRVAPPWFNGFKLFYRQDRPTMTAAEVLALQPPPDLVSYQ